MLSEKNGATAKPEEIGGGALSGSTLRPGDAAATPKAASNRQPPSIRLETKARSFGEFVGSGHPGDELFRFLDVSLRIKSPDICFSR